EASDVPLATPAKLTATRTPVDPRRHALTRAALEHARGDAAAVVATLAPLGLESAPYFADADRAAFLLGHAWLALGPAEPFLALARAARLWPTKSPFTAWLAYEATLQGDTTGDVVRTGAPGSAPSQAADALVADQLLGDGRPEAVLTLVPVGTRDPLL